ncbi:response regulator transcription factor [Coralliovum pocilloporae]|uniref:response regulator transcription factor n=1 Tax=Coralliovum pocilloporae TaxID=3066369 RepID=UPI0033074609
MRRVHVIEDDPEISSLLSEYLSERDFNCTVSGSVEEARTHSGDDFDILIIDIMLPGQSGLDYCKYVRQTSSVPIIILSAVKGDMERIIGIELGADDYLEKPFNPRELLARMNALLRRAQTEVSTQKPNGQIRFSGWSLDRARQQLHAPNAVLVPLSTRELSVLMELVHASPEPVSRDHISMLLDGIEVSPGDRRIDILVSRLRKKLMDTDPTADFIRSVRNEGYKFCAEFEPE